MPRYFLEVSYLGTRYSGFQVQENANTVQAEVEKAIATVMREKITLTGSSRTDAGVHALQNYFHFDTELPVITGSDAVVQRPFIYKMNAVLPEDIAVKSLREVSSDAHCRYDAVGREYHYHICRKKDPFLRDRSFHFPYKMNTEKLQEAAAVLLEYEDFTAFSKRNTQAKTFFCKIEISRWEMEADHLLYRVRANRFLRGMVRAMTATMLQVGREKININEFRRIIESKDCTKASFAVPGRGLFLVAVEFTEGYFV